MDMLTAPNVPLWFQALLSEKFYNACIFHEEERNKEKNMFCLDCHESICSHCTNLHPSHSHSLLQIRRYMCQDVIRLFDAEKLMDCASVQPYTTNNAKVVFFKPKQRLVGGPCRATGNICRSCDKNVKHSYLYCSLSCKLQYLLTTEGSVFNYINKRENISLPEPGPDDGEMSTPDTVLEQIANSASSESGGGAFALAFACTATTEIVRKKRSSNPTPRQPGTELPAASMNRRKGNQPKRAPLF